jgi:transcriptional regulator with XRE-family HTH domain
MSNTYPDRVRGDLLSEWRKSQQWSADELAIAANLSVAQVRQLESGGSHLFYTPFIKEAAARKVARLLGLDPDEVIRTNDDAPTPVMPSVVEELVALSCKKAHATSSWSFVWRHPIFLFAPVVLWLGVIAAGWLQQKWIDGGEEQFWRKTATPNPWTSLLNAWAAPGPQVQVQTPDSQTPTAKLQPETHAGHESAGLLSVAPPEGLGVRAALPAATSSENNKLCQSQPESQAPDTVLRPSGPSKAGNMVHILARKTGVVCVEDAEGSRTWVSLKTREGRSIYGKPPWRIHFELPEQAELYFQGVRLHLPHPELMTVALHEAPVVSQ